MDQLINESLRDFNSVSSVTLLDLIIALTVSALLNVVLARVYVHTHAGHTYSRSFIHTMIFVGITISLIMIIIGSNIARAFALVGAMSIIRFRNPVKDSRDVAFLFIAMAIGMATGTKFHLFAVIFTVFISFVAAALHYFRIGEMEPVSYVLRIRMKPGLRERIEALLGEMTSSYAVISVDRLANQPDFNDFIYELDLRKGATFEDVMAGVGGVSDDISLNLLVGEGNVNV